MDELVKYAPVHIWNIVSPMLELMNNKFGNDSDAVLIESNVYHNGEFLTVSYKGNNWEWPKEWIKRKD